MQGGHFSNDSFNATSNITADDFHRLRNIVSPGVYVTEVVDLPTGEVASPSPYMRTADAVIGGQTDLERRLREMTDQYWYAPSGLSRGVIGNNPLDIVSATFARTDIADEGDIPPVSVAP